MFSYTIPPVTGLSRGNSRWVQAVEKTAAIEPTRPVQRTWVEQYESFGQMRSLAAERISHLATPPQTAQENAAAQQVAQSVHMPRTSSLDYIENAQVIRSLRQSKAEIDPEYIHRRLVQLGNIKKDRDDVFQ